MATMPTMFALDICKAVHLVAHWVYPCGYQCGDGDDETLDNEGEADIDYELCVASLLGVFDVTCWIFSPYEEEWHFSADVVGRLCLLYSKPVIWSCSHVQKPQATVKRELVIPVAMKICIVARATVLANCPE